jgi:hypothetical protein
MLHFLRLFLVTFALVISAGFSYSQIQPYATPQFLELPSLDKKQIVEVEYVENSKFPTLKTNELIRILEISTSLMQKIFSVQVEFKFSDEHKDIKDILNSISQSDALAISHATYDFKNEKGDKSLLIARTANALRLAGDDTQHARIFAYEYLTFKPKSESLTDFSEALVETQLARLRDWSVLKNANGTYLIDSSFANEYLMWNTYAVKKTKKQLTITNQLIASSEYFGNSVHSAIRGGVSNGFTSPASNSSSGVTSIVSLFPFLAVDHATMRIRDGLFASADARDLAIAYMVVHELGHQLMRLGHPFENASCVMTPPKLLYFREWINGIDPKSCFLGSSKAMTLGAVKFIDIRK